MGDEEMYLLKNKKALSTVVTTLIILVVAVLLATVVTFYAINVITTRVQEESLFVNLPHMWYNTSGSWAQGAVEIVNTGGKDVVINQLTVRGQAVNWLNVYYYRVSMALSSDLTVSKLPLGNVANATNTNQVALTNGTLITLKQDTTEQITLKSGNTIVVYIRSPDSIALNDVGVTVGITAFTANAEYYKEVNIQAAQ
jgi:hypothetical protein